MKIQLIITWILRLVAAGIIGMTLYFKFTANEQSVRLFTALGMEPWGRIGTGIIELIACILIFYPRTTGWGALVGVAIMSGRNFLPYYQAGVEI